MRCASSPTQSLAGKLERCCEMKVCMLLLPWAVVNSLFIKGLGTESLPIDRKKADFEVRFRNHPDYHCQPNLWVCSRPAHYLAARYVRGSRFVHLGVPYSESFEAFGWGRIAVGVVHSRFRAISEERG